MSEKFTGVTRISIDPKDLPPISEERLLELRSMRDEDIDFSDIPRLAGKPWRRVLRSQEAPGEGVETMLVVEKDVFCMLREQGEASPERMNAVLREYAEAHRKTA